MNEIRNHGDWDSIYTAALQNLVNDIHRITLTANSESDLKVIEKTVLDGALRLEGFGNRVEEILEA